ncbi:hypothetical protein H8959_009340 [Pygathrix nigripes]
MAAFRLLMKPKVVKKRTKLFIRHHVKELEVLLMCNKPPCAEIAHSASSEKRKAIMERAAQLAIRVTHPNARLRSEENE